MGITKLGKDGGRNASVSAIILAAGSGKRFGEKKQFIKLDGKPLYKHVLDTVSQVVDVDRIVVVGVDIPGGETRSGSVHAGLDGIPEDTDRVVILEAARPLVTIDQVQILALDPYPSTSFVIPLVDTVIGRDGTYYNRKDLYDLLTPQSFDYKLLKEAYDSGDFPDMTDETRVMYEYHGIAPHLIETTNNLMKVTYKTDIPIIMKQAEILRGRND